MVLLIVCWLPGARSLAAQAPQTKEGRSSSQPNDAEVLPVEPQTPKLTDEQLENVLRANTEIIEPHLTRTDFVDLCERLDLDEVQQSCADEAYGRYDEQVQQIHHEVLDRMVPFALQYIRAYEEGGEELARERAGYAVVAAGKIGERYLAQIKQRLDAMLLELQSCLNEIQLEAYPAAIRAWRRSVMLNPQASDSGYDLGYHVDLFEVIKMACKDEPGLRPLLDPGAEPPSDPTLAEARQQCLELLDAFELEFDALLQRRFWHTAGLSVASMRAWVANDEKAVNRTRRKHRRDWMTVYRANTNAAETLAFIIQESSGADLADTWRERYYAAYSPAMYRPKSTDLLYQWLLSEAGLTPEQQAAVEAIYAQYLESRRTLRARARSMLLRLTEELNLSSPVNVAVYDAGRPPAQMVQLYQQHCTLSEQTNLQFRTLLGADHDAAFDEALERIRQARLRSPTR